MRWLRVLSTPEEEADSTLKVMLQNPKTQVWQNPNIIIEKIIL